MRCLYVDLDATLLGPGGSLLAGADGSFSALGVRALEACHRAGAEVVLMSGRRGGSVRELARLIGRRTYIFESGACLVLDGEEHWLTGGLMPGQRTIHEQIEDVGAPALLLAEYAGRLEYHDPWHRDREVSHLFRGLVDAFEADELLERHGHGDLRLVDNGVLHGRWERLAALEQVRGYHLVPRGASKGRAVARHMRARGYSAEEVIAVGDSREDLSATAHVGTFWLVANAVARDPTIGEALAGLSNVRIAGEPYGAGVYEAVVTTLAGG